ncbi:hypothetical protein MRB53_032732 [Persea americana]|uniref:Uncharacterized protein n=1 Tax=Persea americana TaxID=3435 RepID=A0ACC2KT20_PERAE|nr:hypothetical protein MRB53_032732 [Persea americana]
MKTRVTPYVDKIINHETEASWRLQCWQAGELEFQVLSAEYTDVVHLDRRSCICHKWDLLAILCSHGIYAIKLKRYDQCDFSEHWFSSDCYQATYNDVIHATRDRKQWGLRSDERV